MRQDRTHKMIWQQSTQVELIMTDQTDDLGQNTQDEFGQKAG